MTTTVYKYRLYCNEEHTYAYTWSTTEPTLCPNDHANRSNISNPTIVEVSDQQVVITNDVVPSDCYFKVFEQQIPIASAPSGTVSQSTFSWIWDAYVWNICIPVAPDMVGDVVSVYVAKDTVIGLLTANAASGSTTVNVSPSVFNYLVKGLEVSITDGVNTNTLGRATALDASAGTVTFETATTNNFLAGSAFRFSMQPFTQITLEFANDRIIVGRSGLKSKNIPAGTQITAVYTNNNGLAKTCKFIIEMYHR